MIQTIYGKRQEETMQVGEQLPETWRNHPLAAAITEAEIAYVQAQREEREADRRFEAAAEEEREAHAALWATRYRKAQAEVDVANAKAELQRAMGEAGQ